MARGKKAPGLSVVLVVLEVLDVVVDELLVVEVLGAVDDVALVEAADVLVAELDVVEVGSAGVVLVVLVVLDDVVDRLVEVVELVDWVDVVVVVEQGWPGEQRRAATGPFRPRTRSTAAGAMRMRDLLLLAA